MLDLNPPNPSHRMAIFWNKKDALIDLISSSQLSLDNPIMWDNIGKVATRAPRTIYDLFFVEFDKSRTGSLGGIKYGRNHKVMCSPIPLFDKSAFPLLMAFENREIQLFHDLFYFYDKSIVHQQQSAYVAIDAYLSDETASPNRDRCMEILNTVKGAYIIQQIIKIYLQFQMSEREFINLYYMYRKQDALGRIFLDRSAKEIARTAKRNGYSELFCEPISEACLSELQHEAIFSFIFLRSNEITPSINQDGRDFEKRCEELLRKAGFTTTITATTGDFGGDIIAEYQDIRYVIQCKGGRSRVGIKAVQEALAAKGYYKCDAAVVMADAEFTNAAIELARNTNVSLLRRDQIPAIARMII